MLRQSKNDVIRHRAILAASLQKGLGGLENRGAAMAADASAFVSQLMAVRNDMNLPPIFGHKAVASMSAASSALVAAMGHMADAHHQLNAMRGKIGLESVPVSWGDEEPSPKIAEPSGEPTLRVVG